MDKKRILGPIFFGWNWVCNIWDIAEMDKCCQDICCLDKCHLDSWHLLKIVQGTWLYSLVTIESVTAEILLIWTNIARTNVARTNVRVTAGISCRCSQDLMFKVWSKLAEILLPKSLCGGGGGMLTYLSVQLKPKPSWTI